MWKVGIEELLKKRRKGSFFFKQTKNGSKTIN